MAFTKDTTSDEVAIRDVMESWRQGFQAKNLDRIMACYADDVVAFDLMPPLQYEGKEAYRRIWQSGFDQMSLPLSFEFHQLTLSVDEELAYGHSLCRFRGKNPEGENIDVWSRVTDCFRKIDGNWLITHEHTSVPIDMRNGKGLMDLTP